MMLAVPSFWRAALRCGLLLAPALWTQAAPAALRDPTELPAAAQAALAASAPAGEPPAAAAAPRHIIVSNGRAYVVERGRRFGVGDPLGNATIERIEPDAIWLREAGGTRRVPLYAGVTKRPALEPAPASAASAPTAARAAHAIQRPAPSPTPNTAKNPSQKKEAL